MCMQSLNLCVVVCAKRKSNLFGDCRKTAMVMTAETQFNGCFCSISRVLDCCLCMCKSLCVLMFACTHLSVSVFSCTLSLSVCALMWHVWKWDEVNVNPCGPHVFKFWLRAVTSHVCVMTSHGERGATTDLINPGPGTYVPTLKHRQRNRADLGQQGRRL